MPDALADQMPPVQYVDTNGIRMAYYEAGPRGGIPIVFCHGFPELAFSWRFQIAALAAAGRWVIAPDQRGYGLTSRPVAVESYDLEHLTGDLVGLLDHLKVEKAIFAGHDWGGFVVWQMPLRYPDRVAGVIGLNTPFTPRAPADPIAIMRARLGDRRDAGRRRLEVDELLPAPPDPRPAAVRGFRHRTQAGRPFGLRPDQHPEGL
jgi:pimeloyl-ACP methyl ester carboxylesterase